MNVTQVERGAATLPREPETRAQRPIPTERQAAPDVRISDEARRLARDQRAERTAEHAAERAAERQHESGPAPTTIAVRFGPAPIQVGFQEDAIDLATTPAAQTALPELDNLLSVAKPAAEATAVLAELRVEDSPEEVDLFGSRPTEEEAEIELLGDRDDASGDTRRVQSDARPEAEAIEQARGLRTQFSPAQELALAGVRNDRPAAENDAEQARELDRLERGTSSDQLDAATSVAPSVGLARTPSSDPGLKTESRGDTTELATESDRTAATLLSRDGFAEAGRDELATGYVSGQ